MMSDDSGDEMFASADEGSDYEFDCNKLISPVKSAIQNIKKNVEISQKGGLDCQPTVIDNFSKSPHTVAYELMTAEIPSSDDRILLNTKKHNLKYTTSPTVVDADLLLKTELANALDGKCLIPQQLYDANVGHQMVTIPTIGVLQEIVHEGNNYLVLPSVPIETESSDKEIVPEIEKTLEHAWEQTDESSPAQMEPAESTASAVGDRIQTEYIVIDCPDSKTTTPEMLEKSPTEESAKQVNWDEESWHAEELNEESLNEMKSVKSTTSAVVDRAKTEYAGPDTKTTTSDMLERRPGKELDKQDCWDEGSWDVEEPKKKWNPEKTIADVEANDSVDDDGDSWEVDDWDCVDNEHRLPTQLPSNQSLMHSAKSSCPTPSSTVPVARGLVKSLGGGLATLMDSFNPASLASTLAGGGSGENASWEKTEETGQKQRWDWSDWGSLAKSLSSTVENTGRQLLHGGVDVLETIGKKTFTALKDNDPGLAYTKQFLAAPDRGKMPKLSQLLREAAAANQQSDVIPNSHPVTMLPTADEADSRLGDFVYQLESRHALVHMEALELLSHRASARLHTKIVHLESSSSDISNLTSDGSVLDKIWQLLQLSDENTINEDFIVSEMKELSTALEGLHPITSGTNLEKTYKELLAKYNEQDINQNVKVVFYTALGSLAESTTSILAYFHKLSECLLARPDRATQGFFEVAKQISIVLNFARQLNDRLCSISIDQLKQAGDEGNVSASKRCVADLFLETRSANNYLGDAATCLIPIVQLVCVDSFFPDDQD